MEGQGVAASSASAVGRQGQHGPAETEELGASLARRLRPGDVVLVEGEMGAGKTTFVRGAARALGVTEPVTSPTFVVGHLYDAGVAHLDLYRLGGLDDEDPGLLDPYFGPELITFVEWPERRGLDALLGDRRVARHVALAHAGGDRRTVSA